MGCNDPKDSPALAALAELGRDSARPHTTSELDDGLHMLRRRLAGDQGRRRALRRWSLFGATAGACVVLALYATSVSRQRAPVEQAVAVSRIEGGSILEGGYLSQSGRAGVKVFFNEGSKFELTPGTRGRLRAVAADGAHLAVENGTAALAVTQGRQRRWLVEAGPFLVTVKGTAFTVSWDPSSERFELMLRHGRVVVSGPIVGGSISLLAGHRMVVSLPDAQTVITEEPPEETTGVAAGPATVPVAVQAARPAASKDVTARLAPSWRDLRRRSPGPGARATGRLSWRADTGTASSRTSMGSASTRRSRTRPARTCSRSRTRPGIDGAPIWQAPRSGRSAFVFRVRRARSTRCCSAAFEELRGRRDGAGAGGRLVRPLPGPARASVYAAEALGAEDDFLTNKAGGPAEARPRRRVSPAFSDGKLRRSGARPPARSVGHSG